MDKNLKALIDAYLAENLVEEDIEVKKKIPRPKLTADKKFIERDIEGEKIFSSPKLTAELVLYSPRSFKFDFDEFFKKNKGETFSDMLLRLIKVRGEKNSDVYNRAKIDRRIFSRIKNNRNYNAKKDTVIAFAFALKLDLEKTKELLDVAGYTLTKSKRDLIITVFIMQKIFDIDLLNESLYEYNQPLLLDTK